MLLIQIILPIQRSLYNSLPFVFCTAPSSRVLAMYSSSVPLKRFLLSDLIKTNVLYVTSFYLFQIFPLNCLYCTNFFQSMCVCVYVCVFGNFKCMNVLLLTMCECVCELIVNPLHIYTHTHTHLCTWPRPPLSLIETLCHTHCFT